MNTKAKTALLIVATITLLILSTLIILLLTSNSSKPGDTLYGLDKFSESVSLYFAKLNSPIKYAEVNLAIAEERLQELKAITNGAPAQSLIQIVHAQEVEETNDPRILQLINDFNNNINLVIETVEGLNIDASTLALLKNIAQKTTEFGVTITEILPQLNEEELNSLEKTAEFLEELDDEAVSDIVGNVEEDEAENETEDDEMVNLTIEKISTKIAKVEKKIIELEEKVTEKEEKLTAEQKAQITTEISTIKGLVSSARTNLENNLYAAAYNDVTSAKGMIEDTKELLESFIEGVEDTEDSEDAEDEVEDENEEEVEDEIEDESDDNETEDQENDSSNEDSKDEEDQEDEQKPEENEEDEKDDQEPEDREDQEDEEDEPEQEDEEEDESDVEGVSTFNIYSELETDLMF